MRFRKVAALAALLGLVVIPSAAALRFTDDSYDVPKGVVGQQYSHRFELAEGGGCPPYTYRILSGSLPPGLKLETEGSQGGLVHGTPENPPGSYSFFLEGRDAGAAACGDPSDPRVATTQRDFTIQIEPGLSVQQQSLPNPIFVNEAYSFQLTASGGGTQTWSIKSGQLPPGIAISPGGLLSGTPTTLGSYTFVVQVTDGDIRVDLETLSLKVVERLKIATPSVPAAEVGRPLTPLKLGATGGTAPYTWAVTQGTLPAGLTLDAAQGIISGTPKAAGLAQLTISATDADQLVATIQVPLDVKAKLAIADRPLRPAKMGKRYVGRVPVIGGVGPFRWTFVRGTLPDGVRFNTKTGAFVGKPTEAGRFKERVQVTDKLGAKSTKNVVLEVLS